MSNKWALVSTISLLLTTGCSGTLSVVEDALGGGSPIEGGFDEEFSLCVTWVDQDRPMCDLTFTLTNNGDVPETISGNIFVRAGDQVFQSSAQDQLTSGISSVYTTLNPGETQMGRSSFQIPNGAKIQELWIGTLDSKVVSIPINVSTSDLFN